LTVVVLRFAVPPVSINDPLVATVTVPLTVKVPPAWTVRLAPVDWLFTVTFVTDWVVLTIG
jgi:hypothetical protein